MDEEDFEAAPGGAPAKDSDASDPEPDADNAPGSSKDRKPKQRKPFKRGELYALYKGKGPHAMVLDFLFEHDLRAKAVVLVRVGRHLHFKYAADLRAHRDGRYSTLQWAAARSRGESLKCVIEILEEAFCPDLYRDLRLTPHAGNRAAADIRKRDIQDEARSVDILSLMICPRH